jgi:lysophospholipase L1-like esterase
MRKGNILYGACIAATALGTAEIILRVRDRAASKERFYHDRRTMERPWERFDPYSGWELVPNFVTSDVRINRQGFRGPDLMKGGITRILCLGDSTTFGPAGEKNPYPHVVQAVLARRRMSRPVEVINAGVNGHATCNMIFRIKRLLRFNPDIIIICAGWNDLYNEPIDRYEDSRQSYSSYWHYLSKKNVRIHLLAKVRELTGSSDRKPIPLSYSPGEFVPFNFEYNLTMLITMIRKASVIPALVTLPKRFSDTGSAPGINDFQKAALPDFIEDGDFDSFLKVYHSYNTIIRQVAEEKDLPLFDAAAEFGRMKDSSDSCFEDIRHLTPEGCRVLGEFVAQSLIEKGLVR